MDRRSWLWRRKSSEKSPGETDSSGSISSRSERFSDDQVGSILGFEFFVYCYTPIPYFFQKKKILKNIKWNELWILECILSNLESLLTRYLSWPATLQMRSQFISFCSSFGVCRNALKEISQMNPAGLILG